MLSSSLQPVPTKIILDCDPGHDDAIALLLAWGNPQERIGDPSP